MGFKKESEKIIEKKITQEENTTRRIKKRRQKN